MNLIHWDCFEEMSKLEYQSIDLIICDLPYWISKDSWFANGNKNNPECDKKYWKHTINFGNWDTKDIDLNLLTKEYYRLLREWWVIVIFYDIWATESIKSAFNKFKQPRVLQWVKTNPVPINSKLNFLSNSSEYMFSFVKWKKPTYNSEYHNGIFNFPICHWKERTKHPTQKPLNLINELIKIYSNEWDLILDNCMWSWTTWVSARNLNRNFIWIELDKDFFEISYNRINKIC